jgi:hypothetical protein
MLPNLRGPDNNQEGANPKALQQDLRSRWKIVSKLVINGDPKLALRGDV